MTWKRDENGVYVKTDIKPDPAVLQEAFGGFRVQCRECGSERVDWINTLGFSAVSGGWGEAGFRCLDCGCETHMIEA